MTNTISLRQSGAKLTMVVMAYASLISSAEIVKTAMQIIEADTDELTLRAIAASLGVKAPSLYRYFPHKEALERAVAEEALKGLLAEMRNAKSSRASKARFRATAEAYLRFASERFPLYSFLMNRVPQTHGFPVAKELWDVLLNAASDVSGQPGDTAAAVAVWSFLHGYAVLQHSGAFGSSGPKNGFEVGMTAFLKSLRRSAGRVQSQTIRRSARA